jgi:hypothetical protein
MRSIQYTITTRIRSAMWHSEESLSKQRPSTKTKAYLQTETIVLNPLLTRIRPFASSAARGIITGGRDA